MSCITLGSNNSNPSLSTHPMTIPQSCSHSLTFISLGISKCSWLPHRMDQWPPQAHRTPPLPGYNLPHSSMPILQAGSPSDKISSKALLILAQASNWSWVSCHLANVQHALFSSNNSSSIGGSNLPAPGNPAQHEHLVQQWAPAPPRSMDSISSALSNHCEPMLMLPSLKFAYQQHYHNSTGCKIHTVDDDQAD